MKTFKVRVPSGKVIIRTKRARISSSVCANCKKELYGMPRLHDAKFSKLAKTQKRPSRAYGGYFCANCTKDLFKEKARMI